MRREKTIEIDGRQITVRELKTSDVIAFFETEEGMKNLIGLSARIPSDMKRAMKLSMDLSDEEFDEMTEGINSFTLLENAFTEVNADFFASVEERIMNLGAKAGAMAKRLGLSLNAPAGLSRKDTPK